ncbi:MAG: hypothetical protein DRG69_08255 [Deltaproteobacteria bacterium]|nr:MAG: hypothetical protein DRG69_08255 [Deltaproteobacteria bacterium]
MKSSRGKGEAPGASSRGSRGGTKGRCPQCGREVPWEGNPYRPFCSERCKMVDLGRWVGEEYRIPSEEEAPPQEPEE